VAQRFTDPFQGTESLIDMGELFGYLVRKVKDGKVIDPFSKEDLMWKIVDFYTGTKGAMDHGALSPKHTDLALYFRYHMKDQNAFTRILNSLVRLEGKPEFFESLMGELRTCEGFDKESVRKNYLKLKASGIRIDAKAAEFLLFAMKLSGMWGETLDLCENWDSMVRNSKHGKDIKQFYLGNALLNFKSSRHYYEQVEQAIKGKDEADPLCISLKTKALFKDGNAKEAVDQFKKGIEKMRERAKLRVEELEKIFDAAYDEGG